MDYSQIKYTVPEKWYEGSYQDKAACCSAARSFSMVHSTASDECWLIIHGYRGYPGEFVRPAVDLYDLGYDVFVPRLPGHGTSWRDFVKSGEKDWTEVPRKAIADLKTRYSKVHILSHSMGTAIAVNIAWLDPSVGKIVLACPSLTNLQMTLPARIVLRLAGLFTPRLNCHWHPSTKFHLHYENAPCDDEFLGKEYWTWYFTHRLFDYWNVMKKARKILSQGMHDHLVLCSAKDKIISVPSAEIFCSLVGKDNANVLIIPEGTHFLFYDKSVSAEQEAVSAVCAYAKSV